MVFKDSPERLRLTLIEKRTVVEEYRKFCANQCLTQQSNNVKENRSKTTIMSFITYYNKDKAAKDYHDEKNIFKWIKADERFEFTDWEGENKLTNRNCTSQKAIVEKINRSLSVSDPDTARWIRIERSKVCKEQYGAIALREIPVDTKLGYFRGKLVVEQTLNLSESNTNYNPHRCNITGTTFYVDATAFNSCFGRYFVASHKQDIQNVSVEKSPAEQDHNQSIRFSTKRKINKDEELVIAPLEKSYTKRRRKTTRRIKVVLCGDQF
jgi:hypothetical protein